MSIFKNLFKLILLSTLTLALIACHRQSQDENTIKVGTISGPETELMEVAKKSC